MHDHNLHESLCHDYKTLLILTRAWLYHGIITLGIVYNTLFFNDGDIFIGF